MPSLTFREYEERRVSERGDAGEPLTEDERAAYDLVKTKFAVLMNSSVQAAVTQAAATGAALKKALDNAGYTQERWQQIAKGYDAWKRLPAHERRRWANVTPESFLSYYRSQSPCRGGRPRGARPRVRRSGSRARSRSPGHLPSSDDDDLSGNVPRPRGAS